MILADEPTGNLDANTAAEITKLLTELQQHSAAMLVVVTHSNSLAEAMGRRARLEAGRLVTD